MFFDFLSALYLLFKFSPKYLSKKKEIVIIFARGAFRRDIKDIANLNNLIVINGELIRRILRQRAPDGYLEQVIALSYKEMLRNFFPLTIRVFNFFINNQKTRIIYGGVDYFEVAIFANRECFSSNVTVDAIFHENYAIEYVANINMQLYENIKEPFIFDNLYTYGPPATKILKRYTHNPNGPISMVMPRLARMENDQDFFYRLNRIDNLAFSNTILLLAFPGSEYLAPICFTATALHLAEQVNYRMTNVIFKFKNKKSALPYVKQCASINSAINWEWNGSVEEFVWKSGFTIVFNSISLYEALLGPTIVLIPNYLDSRHDLNLLQESPHSIPKMNSVKFLNSLDDIELIMAQFDNKVISQTVMSERALRKKIVESKFYLS
jgi:hypothetical protein